MSSQSRPTREQRHRPYHDDPRWRAARDRLVAVKCFDVVAEQLRQSACDDMVLIEIEYGYPHG